MANRVSASKAEVAVVLSSAVSKRTRQRGQAVGLVVAVGRAGSPAALGALVGAADRCLDQLLPSSSSSLSARLAGLES
jgi:hypothetical protein